MTKYADARRLLDAGARVALATDFNPGSAPAADFQLVNLLAASQLRMTAPEILCACTYNGAAALGMEHTHGTLEPGRAANILLWQVDGKMRTGRVVEMLEEMIVRRLQPSNVCVRGRWVSPPPSLSGAVR